MKYQFRKLITACFVMLASFGAGSVSAAPATGAETFKAKCVMCHGTDGSGNTPMGQKLKIRDLRSAEVQQQGDQDLTAIINNGKPPMPAYAKTLSPGAIHELVTYLRNLQPKA